jgi:hypothetical protein
VAPSGAKWQENVDFSVQQAPMKAVAAVFDEVAPSGKFQFAPL